MTICPGLFRHCRALWKLLILLGTSAQAGFMFAVRRARGPESLAERAHWLHTWCGKVIRRLPIDIAAEGRFPDRGLLVCNHLSYLDILVLSASAPCVFVAKKDVRSWPLYGQLARLGGTIFIDRSRRLDVTRAGQRIAEALRAGLVVVLFPEATSSDGSTVLPFRPPLFEAAIREHAPVSTAYISYAAQDAFVGRDICYWGTMTFLPHLLRFLSLRHVSARLRFAAECSKFDDRKLAAATTRLTILKLSRCG
jgi:1-acyl-sn-glycerol-3-phosphate acyltransferase